MKLSISIFLLLFILSATACSQTPIVEKPQTTTETTTTQNQVSVKEQKPDKSLKHSLKKVGNGFKKVGHGIEQTFDKMSKKDKDGDGE